MSETMRLVVAGIAWIAFWFGIPTVVAFWKLNHDEDASVITGKPLVHPHAAHHALRTAQYLRQTRWPLPPQDAAT